MGRPRRGRLVVLVLRPGVGVSRAENAHRPEPVRGGGDGADHHHHLHQLLANHRGVSHRRRRLPGRKQAAFTDGRCRVRLRADRRLHFDHRLERGGWHGCDLQHAPGGNAGLEGEVFPRHRHVPHAAEPARREGIGDALGAGVFCVRPELHVRHYLCHFRALRRIARRRPRHGVGRERRRGGSRLVRSRRRRAARLQPRRGHLHRHRGRQQRPQHPARAARADRQAHDDLHGGVAVVRRRRTAAGVSALSRHAGGRQDAERRAV